MHPFTSRRAWRTERSPEQVWDAVLDVGSYRAWWPWLEALDVPALRQGASSRAVIRAPAGYRLRVELRLQDVDRPRRLRAAVSGDLEGHGTLALRPTAGGTVVDVEWSLQARRTLLAVLAVLARPVLVDGHDRIVADGVDRFGARSGVRLRPVTGTAGQVPAGRGLREVAWAAALAGLLSGAPSTVHAVVSGRSPLSAARAAGAVLGRPGLVRGAAAHAALSAGWATVLAGTLPPRRTVATGAVAGLAIAALDLGLVGRRIPAIRRLPVLPQVADHLAFGALVGAALTRRP